ncbi:MgtC/SapB family protein [Brucella cytisi]|jgi:putative Mg2+ transporter-C (MgtC) family protein|uniref:Protein MgtC n=1 Tax=Brucella cytisi TaxID=407152 RepID=A0A1J6HM44_9HYPH|nr:MgtC/SapB family protein [Brucella cytisi]OIS93451.1 methyltransferase [Brucella cytisi]
MSEVVAIQSIMIDLGLALLLGSAIGLERQLKQRHSGLATHGLVALGAAAYASLPHALGLVGDLRMGSQVVTGIGFLGAGLIIKDGASIKGLSTAATIWSTGAVGVLTGYGLWLLAIETAFFIVCLNISLPRIAVLVNRYSFVEPEIEQFYLVKFRCPAESEVSVRALLIQTLDLKKLRFHAIRSHHIEGSDEVEVEATLFAGKEDDRLVEGLVAQLSLRSSIKSTSWLKLEDTDWSVAH